VQLTSILVRSISLKQVTLRFSFSYFFCSSAVLGIGERVGITPLGALISCLYAADPEYVKAKYNLPMLREIENLVADAVEVSIPFHNPVTYVALLHV